MEAILKSDLFFFVTGVAVIVLTVVVLVALYYVIKILRDVKDLTRIFKKEGENIAHDIGGAREGIKKQGRKINKFINKKMSTSNTDEGVDT